MGKEPTKGVDVDQAVAAGAAIYAGLNLPPEDLTVSQQKVLANTKLQLVCNHYLGVIAKQKNPQTGRDEDNLYMEVAEIINKKGVIHFASHPDEKKFISIKPYDLIEGKKISGSWGGNSKPDRDISRFCSILKTNKLRLKELYSKIYNLNEINLAVSEFKKNLVFRPIIKMDHTS